MIWITLLGLSHTVRFSCPLYHGTISVWFFFPSQPPGAGRAGLTVNVIVLFKRCRQLESSLVSVGAEAPTRSMMEEL